MAEGSGIRQAGTSRADLARGEAAHLRGCASGLLVRVAAVLAFARARTGSEGPILAAMNGAGAMALGVGHVLTMGDRPKALAARGTAAPFPTQALASRLVLFLVTVAEAIRQSSRRVQDRIRGHRDEGAPVVDWTGRRRAMNRILVAAAVLLAGLGPAAANGATAERTVSDIFAGVSPEGRRILTEALRDNRRPAEREAAAKAHGDLLDALAREPFDRAGVEAAMLAEERLLDQQREARRGVLLDAYARLTPEDRRAFVAATRAVEGRRGLMGGR